MHLCGIFPAIVLVAVALPLDQVLESSLKYLAVLYSLYFIMFLTVNKDRVQRRAALSLWNQICWGRHQFDHWKDRVQVFYGLRYLEVVGTRSNTTFYYIGTKEVKCQLLGWLRCLNITSIQVHLVSGSILRCWLSVMIIVVGHVFLSLCQCRLCLCQCRLHPVCEFI